MISDEGEQDLARRGGGDFLGNAFSQKKRKRVLTASGKHMLVFFPTPQKKIIRTPGSAPEIFREIDAWGGGFFSEGKGGGGYPGFGGGGGGSTFCVSR